MISFIFKVLKCFYIQGSNNYIFAKVNLWTWFKIMYKHQFESSGKTHFLVLIILILQYAKLCCSTLGISWKRINIMTNQTGWLSICFFKTRELTACYNSQRVTKVFHTLMDRKWTHTPRSQCPRVIIIKICLINTKFNILHHKIKKTPHKRANEADVK